MPWRGLCVLCIHHSGPSSLMHTSEGTITLVKLIKLGQTIKTGGIHTKAEYKRPIPKSVDLTKGDWTFAF